MIDPMQEDIDAIGRIDAVPTILDVVCRVTGMRFAAISRMTKDRWVACSVLDGIGFGLAPGGELKIETTLCNQVRDQREPVVIDNVAEDPSYCGHPIPAMYGFQSYISMPIILRDGQIFGTLCAIDPRPARLRNPEMIGMFRLFAELIAAQLSADRALRAAEAELADQREGAKLREQFIAVLGHDLRNPVAAIASGLRLLAPSVGDVRGRHVMGLMQTSVVRITGLIGNLMDFARARLGDGLRLATLRDAALLPVLEHVVAELLSAHPGRDIRTEFALEEPVAADAPRIAQLFSNLLGNALTHGSLAAPIRVAATARGGVFTLTVANDGAPIPPAALENLFQPFFRGSDRMSQQGLGLGLYIAAEIARAHGGALDVRSDATETCFTFTLRAATPGAMPAAPQA